MAVGRVNVYVNGAVAMCTPASLTALTDNVGQGPWAQNRVGNKMVDFFASDVFDAQVVVDELDEVLAKVGRGGLGS